MKREEFVKWFDINTGFEKEFRDSDSSWREMVDYASINEATIEYGWEELYWGGSDWKERLFTFEEFIEAYKNDAIK